MESPYRKRTFFGPVLVFTVFGVLGVLGWSFVRNLLPERTEYRLSAAHVRISDAPPWIPADFVDSVLQDSGLTSASLLEPSLPEKLARAFAADSWVERVVRVELHFPSGANVTLVYRSPVALIEVAQGLLPVDSNGVLLRTDYFVHIAPEKADDYPRVVGIRSTPLGGVGTTWGDPIVHATAQLAVLLEGVGVATILPTVEKTPTGARAVFRLKTAAGTEFPWGRFDADDPRNDMRKKRLLELAQLYGSLDKVPPSLLLIE